jgi:hypothetical protein
MESRGIAVAVLLLMTVRCTGPGGTPTPPVPPGPGPVQSCTRFVSPQGNDDNPGTESAPWRTIQYAVDHVASGEVICVRAGTYDGDLSITASGTADTPITLIGEEGVTLRGGNNGIVFGQGASHWRLHNLRVQDFQVWGVSLLGTNSDIVLSGLELEGGEAGVHFTAGDSGQPPRYGPVEEITLADSRIHDTQFTAVDCTPGPCNRMVFRRLEIYGAGLVGESSFGSDGLAVERGQDILVEDCHIHDNGGDGIDLNSRDREGNVQGILVRRNIVARNHLQAIKLWAGGRMENNVVFGQGINPVVVGVYPSTVEVVNNTIAYNMWDSYSARDYAFIAAYPEIGYSPPVQLTLVNNIFAFNTGPNVGEPSGLYLGAGVRLVREGHNLFWSRGDCEIQADFVEEGRCFSREEITNGTWAAATGQGTGDVVADPLFVGAWPVADLHLQEGSPARDAGTPEGAPSEDVEGNPRDAQPDIGAYEARR